MYLKEHDVIVKLLYELWVSVGLLHLDPLLAGLRLIDVMGPQNNLQVAKPSVTHTQPHCYNEPQ